MSAASSILLSRVHFPVTVLGPGTRLGVWVQGCSLACPGCMSRDTWSAVDGVRTPVADVVEMWRAARSRGATGLTVSGGEPSEQSEQVAELIDGIRAAAGTDDPAGDPVDVLVFTGLDEAEFRAAAPQLSSRADAAIVGRFDITRPTELMWRGSANQALVPFTALGVERYGPFRDATTSSPALQFAVEGDRIWTVGVPRIGDLPALEKRLKAHGIVVGDVSWRP